MHNHSGGVSTARFPDILKTAEINPLSTNPTKWSNTLKQFADELCECIWQFCKIGAEKVKPGFKKKSRIDKENVSTLSKTSKIFERLIFEQLMFFQ